MKKLINIWEVNINSLSSHQETIQFITKKITEIKKGQTITIKSSFNKSGKVIEFIFEEDK